MRKQVNKHCIAVKYQINNFVKLLSKNIKIIRLLKKLNGRTLNLFKIVKKMNAFYYLKFFSDMHQYNIFSFNYSRFAVNNLLSNQK